MFFKNLQIFRLSGVGLFLATFGEQIAKGQFRPCSDHESYTRGWVSPRGDGYLVYASGRQWMISLAVQERLLPSSVVNEEVSKRADALTKEQGYAPGRKAMKELKERVIDELMPRAFTRTRRTNVWIDPVNGWFVVDAASMAKAEEVIEHLRLCLDNFPLKLLRTTISPQAAMADWLAGGEAPTGFTIDRDCEVKAVGEEKATVRYVHHPLADEAADEIKAHLAAGKLPTKLALTWDERISFVLTEKLEIKRLAFLDIVKDQAESAAETADDMFDSDFAIMTGELSRFLVALVDALGGEIVEESAA